MLGSESGLGSGIRGRGKIKIVARVRVQVSVRARVRLESGILELGSGLVFRLVSGLTGPGFGRAL